MLIGTDHRCPQCMTPAPQAAAFCPQCHYDMQEREIDPICLTPGSLLQGRYLIGNAIFSSRESTIYVAYDQELDAVVNVKEFVPRQFVYRNAYKELVPEEGCDQLFADMRKEFLNLHLTLSKLRTLSSLVQVYAVFEQNSTAYAVLEHVKGMSLRDYLSNNYGELSWEVASPMFVKVMKTLSRLHKMGIIHHGISPETIWVTPQSDMKIGGFSISAYQQKNGKVIPDLYAGYAAPEQYDGLETCGPWTDVYGLAAVMYKTLTGTMPTESNTRGFNDNLIPPDILNSNVPKNVSIAIMSALTLSPKIRTQMMDDLFADVITPPRATTQYSVEYVINEKLKKDREKDNDEENDSKNKPEARSRRYVFTAMGITLCILLFASAVLIFFLFSQNIFG